MRGLVSECEKRDDDSTFITNFKTQLDKKLQEKFGLDNIQPDSCEVIATALHPRFKTVKFLDEVVCDLSLMR